MLDIIAIIALVLYGIGFIVISALSLLSIKSIFSKTFSLPKLLKKSVTAFFTKPDFALIILLVVLIYALGSMFLGAGRIFMNIADSLNDQKTAGATAVGAASMASFIMGSLLVFVLASPAMALSNGFMMLAYQGYRSKGTLDAEAWKGLFSIKGLYLLIGALLSGLLILVGFALFLFPGLVLTWAFLYVPYLIVLKDQDPLTALMESWRMFRENPWDAIFLTAFFAAGNALLLTNGLESFVHYLVILPICTFVVTEYVLGGKG